jgi:hypothetical protein
MVTAVGCARWRTRVKVAGVRQALARAMIGILIGTAQDHRSPPQMIIGRTMTMLPGPVAARHPSFG